MTRLTISKCSDWLGGKGIINILTENYNVPWKDKVDGTILDLDYYGNHSGNKIISPLVEQLIDNTGLSDGNMNKLAQLIFSKYGYNWSKLWEATQLEYNPIHNYDGDEEEILTVKETGTDSVVGQGGGQSKTYGFNSINAVDADESSTDSSNTETKDLQTETTRKFKKGGNLGVTTTQQMMTSEYEYRINYEFFIAVFKDVDKILVIESYGDVKIKPCDVIIQSSYSLPPATENNLGGIKVGDNLTITSDGRLSATGGTSSEEYGFNSNGEYYRFSSGLQICTKQWSGEKSCDVVWGSLYEPSSPIDFGSWAADFIEKPITCVTSTTNNEGKGAACWIESHYDVTSSYAGRALITRATQGVYTFVLNIIAIGRWK